MQTQVAPCMRCRRLFNYVSGDRLCPKCREEVESEFQKVKDYIRENKGCNVIEVAEACEVSEKQIKEWVRQERLEMTTPTGDITCQKCGIAITSGRYCDKCRAEMVGEFKEAVKKDAPAPEPPKDTGDNKDRMRFLR